MLTLWDALFGILGGGVWPRACNPNPISDQTVFNCSSPFSHLTSCLVKMVNIPNVRDEQGW